MRNPRPYSILLRNRPIRHGFLVNTDAYPAGSPLFDDVFDDIVAACDSTWGGRRSVILRYNGDVLDESAWQLLEVSDVDYLTAFAPIAPALLTQLDNRLAPVSVDVKDCRSTPQLAFSLRGVPVSPTGQNAPGLSKKLLLFQFSPTCEPLVRRFVSRNFGTYSQWFDQHGTVRHEAWLERLLLSIPVHTVRIDDRSTLASALDELGGSVDSKHYSAPVEFTAIRELSASHLTRPHVLFDFEDRYQVFVGDSPEEITALWNGAIWKRTWGRPYAHSLWIPTELASDRTLHASIGNWLRYQCDVGSIGTKIVEFLTATVPLDQVDEIGRSICSGRSLPHSKSNTVAADVEKGKAVVKEAANARRVLLDPATEFRHIASSSNETLRIPEPDLLRQQGGASGSWMVDVQIELLTSQQFTPQGQGWWLLPRRNAGTLVSYMFNRPARVNRDGYFSAWVEHVSTSPEQSVEPQLSLRLPRHQAVIETLILEPHGRPFFTTDPRYSHAARHSQFQRLQISQSGRYLQGLLEMFGGFGTAKVCFEREFWNKMFERLVAQNAKKDERLRKDIANLLRKNLRSVSSQAAEKSEYLAARAVGLMQRRFRPVPLPYSAFEEERQYLETVPLPEVMEFSQGGTAVSHHGPAHLTEEEMRDGLSELVARGVLRLGLQIRCSFCGVETWYHIDDARQAVSCGGCGRQQTLGCEERWYYSVNSLAEIGVSSGQRAVLQSLAALASHSWHTFMFSPSIELFTDASSNAWHEVDVLAICDGEFIIGEVKGGDRPVTKDDFTELAEIATELRPNRAIMFMPVAQRSSLTGQWLEGIRPALIARGITPQIYELPTY